MRIAIVGSTQEIVGGAEVYLKWVLSDFAARGHAVGFAFEFPAQREERAADAGLHGVQRWCIQDLGIRRLIEELRRFAPDVVYLNGTHDPMVEFELSRSFRCVLFAHGYYGTCATGTRVYSWPIAEVCSRTFGVGCLAVNYARGCGILRPNALLRDYLYQSRRLRTLSAVRAVIVASQHVRSVFERQGIDRSKLAVIPCPVIGVSRASAPPAARQFTNRVLFLGRLTHLKGLTDAVASVAKASQLLGRRLVLQVGGEGPERENGREAASAAGIAVEFHGWVNDVERAELMAQADVLIVPSRWPEPFGMVGIEAGCVGLPAVAYPLGGICDWLRPGVSGELAEGEGMVPNALGNALARALRTPEHHQALREGAWRTSFEYSEDVHRGRLLDLLQGAVFAE